MPDSWTFPGFITFALLGPIVPNGMMQYRSELLMSMLPSPPTRSANGNGRSAQRSTKHNSNNKKQRQQNQTYKQNLPDVTAAAYGTTLHQRIQVAGLANMRVHSEKREVGLARINALQSSCRYSGFDQ